MFTGKQRDCESETDYFGGRYYNNTLCRWLSPDKPMQDNHLHLPQSWNLYSHVRNNPIRFIDEDGFLAREKNVKFKRNVVLDNNGSMIHSQEVKIPTAKSSTRGRPFYLFTEKGNRILAHENQFSQKASGYNTNCHGLTFADGQYTIGNPNDVQTILDDEYTKIDRDNNQSVQEVDVAIFSDNNGTILHSITVSAVGSDGSASTIIGLGGTIPEAYKTTPQEELKKYESFGACKVTYFRKTQPDPKAMSLSDKENFKKSR